MTQEQIAESAIKLFIAWLKRDTQHGLEAHYTKHEIELAKGKTLSEFWESITKETP